MSQDDPPHAEDSHAIYGSDGTRRDISVHDAVCVLNHGKAQKEAHHNTFYTKNKKKERHLHCAGVIFMRFSCTLQYALTTLNIMAKYKSVSQAVS